MQSKFPSCLRQRKNAGASDSAAEFTLGQSGMDERTMAKLLGRPTLTTCMHRANELLAFAVECLARLGTKMFLVLLIPTFVVFISIFATTKFEQLSALKVHDDKKMLQFVFIVVTCCYSLLFFTIAVDYSKLLRISRAALNQRRQQNAKKAVMQQELSSAEILMMFRRGGPNDGSAVSLGSKDPFVGLRLNSYTKDNTGTRESHASDTSEGTTCSTMNRSNSVRNCTIESEIPSSWWDTYSLLRMNLHCVIFLTRRAFSLKFVTSNSRKSVKRRKAGLTREGRPGGRFLAPFLKRDALAALILTALVIVTLASLTLLKCYKIGTDPQFQNWLVESRTWTAGVACFLQLHFILLLGVAVVVSRSPSEVHTIGTLATWLFTLLCCVIIQASVLPSVFELPKCLLSGKLDNGFFAVFTDIEEFSDSPIVNSLGASRPKVKFLLGSLVSAIIASVLYQLNILQMSLGSVGTMFQWMLNVSPVEGIVLLLNMFSTQINFLILFMPFLGKLSESELFCIFVLMLVRTPSEDDEYWDYLLQQKHGSVLQPMVQDKVHTYIPQRMAIRNLLAFPLIILFCRIVYPLRGKFGVRASMFRRLHSLKCGRPFSTLGESLLYYVAYCTRSLCRYFVMVLFFHCLEFMFRFTLQTINFQLNGVTIGEAVLIELATLPVALVTDLTELYPSKTRSLGQYAVERFMYPKTTYHHYFVLDPYLNRNRTNDTFLDAYNGMTTPIKEIVLSGSLHWETVAIFVAFTTDCLGTDRRTRLAFLLRGCVAAVLIYAAMNNLLLLMCEPATLRKLHNISEQWIETINEHIRSGGNCTT